MKKTESQERLNTPFNSGHAGIATSVAASGVPTAFERLQSAIENDENVVAAGNILERGQRVEYKSEQGESRIGVVEKFDSETGIYNVRDDADRSLFRLRENQLLAIED